MQKSGKTMTFVLVIVIILFVCVTGIALFFLSKEIDKRQDAELNVKQLKVTENKLNVDLKGAQDQVSLLEGKKKDLEADVERLTQEVDLQRTTKEQVQKENETLQANLQKVTQEKEDIRSRLSQDLKAAQDKYNAVKSDLDKAVAKTKELEAAKQQVTTQIASAGGVMNVPVKETEEALNGSSLTNANGVELGKIVVNAQPASKGKIISVDVDTDFVIVSLGEKDGVTKGAVLSVSRGDQYLGDVKVSRVLSNMSAADFVLPLKSSAVAKDDTVSLKDKK